MRSFLRNPRKVRKNCLKKNIFLSRRFLKGYGKDCMIAWKTIFSPIHWKLWLAPKSMLHKCSTIRWSYPTRWLKMQKLDMVSTCHTVTMARRVRWTFISPSEPVHWPPKLYDLMLSRYFFRLCHTHTCEPSSIDPDNIETFIREIKTEILRLKACYKNPRHKIWTGLFTHDLSWCINGPFYTFVFGKFQIIFR